MPSDIIVIGMHNSSCQPMYFMVLTAIAKAILNVLFSLSSMDQQDVRPTTRKEKMIYKLSST